MSGLPCRALRVAGAALLCGGWLVAGGCASDKLPPPDPAATAEAEVSAAALTRELRSAVRAGVGEDAARFGTNAWADLDQLIDDGVDRVFADGPTEQRVDEARANAGRLAEAARELAADSPRRNITRVELMGAVSELSPLYPYVTEPVAPVVPRVPGTPIDPPAAE